MESKLLEFFAIIEHQVNDLGYGTLSVNVILVNGIPKIDSLNMVRNKRIKYSIDKFDRM